MHYTVIQKFGEIYIKGITFRFLIELDNFRLEFFLIDIEMKKRFIFSVINYRY